MEQVNPFFLSRCFWCHYNHNLQHKDDVFTKSNQEGIDRVLNKNGEYAFMMESTVSAHIMMMMVMIHTLGWFYSSFDERVLWYEINDNSNVVRSLIMIIIIIMIMIMIVMFRWLIMSSRENVSWPRWKQWEIFPFQQFIFSVNQCHFNRIGQVSWIMLQRLWDFQLRLSLLRPFLHSTLDFSIADLFVKS